MIFSIFYLLGYTNCSSTGFTYFVVDYIYLLAVIYKAFFYGVLFFLTEDAPIFDSILFVIYAYLLVFFSLLFAGEPFGDPPNPFINLVVEFMKTLDARCNATNWGLVLSDTEISLCWTSLANLVSCGANLIGEGIKIRLLRLCCCTAELFCGERELFLMVTVVSFLYFYWLILLLFCCVLYLFGEGRASVVPMRPDATFLNIPYNLNNF